jgi:hypothetical protein
MSSAVAPPGVPIFATPPRGRFPLAFLGFLAVSLFAHAATFLLFQVVYPQRVTIPPPAPQVTLLTPSTPEEEALLRWVAAEDPALVAASAAPMPPDVFSVTYQPSFGVLRTPPRLVPPPSERPQPPPSPIALPLSTAKALPPAPGGPAPAVASSVALSGGLAGRTIALPPITARFAIPLEAAQFLLAVNDRGEVRHTVLQRSSSDAAADAAAALALAAASVSPSSEHEEVAWGFATISWGGDVYLLSGDAK